MADNRGCAGEERLGTEGLRPLGPWRLARPGLTTRAHRQQDFCEDRDGPRRAVRYRLPDSTGGSSVTDTDSRSKPLGGLDLLGPGIAVAATIAVTVFAPTGRIAWGRLCLLNGLASLGLPLASLVFSVLLGHHASRRAVPDAAKTGAKIGPGFGGIIAPWMLGLVGCFFWARFSWRSPLPFCGMRRARRRQLAGCRPIRRGDNSRCPLQ
jgi:hypothetical protein